ncbi:MAG: NEW3 domain-containing protein [Anaerolineae bacterium]
MRRNRVILVVIVLLLLAAGVQTPALAQKASKQLDSSQGLTVTAEVTGRPELTVTAPDGRLSGQAYVGKETSLKIVVQNTGSAPARNVELSASQPSGWSVEFEPKQISAINPDKQVEVTARIKPA